MLKFFKKSDTVAISLKIAEGAGRYFYKCGAVMDVSPYAANTAEDKAFDNGFLAALIDDAAVATFR